MALSMVDGAQKLITRNQKFSNGKILHEGCGNKQRQPKGGQTRLIYSEFAKQASEPLSLAFGRDLKVDKRVQKLYSGKRG